MVFEIIVLPIAKLEIVESVEFYEARSKGLGKRFLQYLKGYLQILAVNPYLFELKRQPFYRELPLKSFPFVVIYEIF